MRPRTAEVCRRAGAAALVACACSALLSTCHTKQAPPEYHESALGSAGTRAAVLGAFADCALKEATAFRDRSASLTEAAHTHEATLSPDTLTAVRAAWESAIDQWQVLELFQFGPAAMSGVPGGRDIRDEIYIWPQFNRCLIEQIIVNEVYLQDSFGEQLANARGLGGLEYALSHTGQDNACPSSNPINATGSWAALVAAGLGAAKAGYARAAAQDVQRNAEALLVAWDPNQGGFWTELAHAGNGSSVYSTTQAGLNAVSDALFYLDTEVKDMKLARPLGLQECDAGLCIESVESPFAGRSKIHVRNNLLGFRKLFSGCTDGEGLGFDDLLVEVGQAALGDRMKQAIDGALAAVDAIEEPSLELALAADLESVRRLYDAVKAIMDLFKTEFIGVLDLERPVSAEGDND